MRFSTLYLGGIPPIITNESAFLSFVAAVSALDALAGYRYANTITESGERFKAFVARYLPDEYKRHVDALWRFRCHMLHGFSPEGFALTHHRSENHFKTHPGTGKPILNAEDFYAALLSAAQKYFAELRTDVALRRLFMARLKDEKHGRRHQCRPDSLEQVRQRETEHFAFIPAAPDRGSQNERRALRCLSALAPNAARGPTMCLPASAPARSVVSNVGGDSLEYP